MAFNSLNDIVALLGNHRPQVAKAFGVGNPTLGGNPLQSSWRAGTLPGSSAPATQTISLGGANLGAASSGSLFQPLDSTITRSGGFISYLNIQANVAGGQFEIWDRLYEASYTSGPSHATMTVSMGVVPRSHASGNQIFIDARSPAATVRSIALTVETWSLDVRTANFNIPASLSAYATIPPVWQGPGPPAAIRRILTVAAPNSAAVASVDIVIRRPMAEAPVFVANQPYTYNMFDLAMPEVLPDACIEFCYRPISTTVVSFAATMGFIQNSV